MAILLKADLEDLYFILEFLESYSMTKVSGKNPKHHENDKHKYEREDYLESRKRIVIDDDRDERDYQSGRGRVRKRLSISSYTPPRIRKHSPDFLDQYRPSRHVNEERAGLTKAVKKELVSNIETRGFHQIFTSMKLKKESALRMEQRNREA